MTKYSIKQSKTDSRFFVMKDGSRMAACYTYSQAYGVLNRMQLDDTIKSINQKYDKKKRRLNMATNLFLIIAASVIVLALILENK